MNRPFGTIVFFGSGPVAAASLRQLLAFIDVEAVITKPQPEHGHRSEPPVEKLARAHGLPLHTPANRQALSDLFAAQSFESRAGVVVDYGVIIAGDVIDSFELGIVNSHFSLLPEWRGADPITFSILSGQTQTGVSLMVINEQLDEGELLAQENLSIEPDWTTDDLTRHLVDLSGSMLERYLPLYLTGKLHPYPQDTARQPTYSRRLTKADGRLDWHKPAVQLEREIRAFHGWPKSYTSLGPVEVVVTRAHTSPEQAGKPGEIAINGSALAVSTGEGSLVIDELKPAGKPAMSAQAFLAGYGQKLSK